MPKSHDSQGTAGGDSDACRECFSEAVVYEYQDKDEDDRVTGTRSVRANQVHWSQFPTADALMRHIGSTMTMERRTAVAQFWQQCEDSKQERALKQHADSEHGRALREWTQRGRFAQTPEVFEKLATEVLSPRAAMHVREVCRVWRGVIDHGPNRNLGRELVAALTGGPSEPRHFASPIELGLGGKDD